MENYKPIAKPSFRYLYFLYMDHAHYIGDSLFIREKCRVRFLKEYRKPGTDWLMVYVKVAKKDAAKFRAAMQEFRSAALLKGHTDYDGAMEKYWRPFLEKSIKPNQEGG